MNFHILKLKLKEKPLKKQVFTRQFHFNRHSTSDMDVDADNFLYSSSLSSL